MLSESNFHAFRHPVLLPPDFIKPEFMPKEHAGTMLRWTSMQKQETRIWMRIWVKLTISSATKQGHWPATKCSLEKSPLRVSAWVSVESSKFQPFDLLHCQALSYLSCHNEIVRHLAQSTEKQLRTRDGFVYLRMKAKLWLKLSDWRRLLTWVQERHFSNLTAD